MRMLTMTGGEAYEEEYGYQWDTSDNDDQNYEVQDTFAMEGTNEEESLAEEHEQPDSEDFDEDDQDNYS